MSGRKRPLIEISQATSVAHPRNPTTPFASQPRQSLTNKRTLSARSLQRPSSVRPGSARGILRRLAKITAPTTKRRVLTPTTILHGKENLPLDESDDEDQDLKRPKFAFEVEASIEEDDSGLLVPPTPSALLETTDDEDDAPPTITFLKDAGQFEADGSPREHSALPLVPQSDPTIQNDYASEEDDEDNTTFLTERGRRAISEEPTRMSRYSFGSIRMSDFGSELEVRRESEKQKKSAVLEAEDDDSDDDSVDENDIVHLGGETEDLRNLQRPSSAASNQMEETLHEPTLGNQSFQLDVHDEPSFVDEEDVNARQRMLSGAGPVIAQSIIEIDDADAVDQRSAKGGATLSSGKQSRRQTLLESVAAASKPRSRKRLKMNQRGNMVPSLPTSLIKRIVNELQAKAGKRKIPLGKDHMKALEQATEWFFEQVSEDLDTFASHGKRKKRIDTDDVLLLMRRQRVLRQDGELKELAKQWLPREILAELDLPNRP